jgi:Mg2+ and Co2+ transporter CorA
MNDNAQSQLASPTTTVVDAAGVRRNVSTDDLAARVADGKFFWLDICGDGTNVEASLLSQAGLDDIGVTWALRFGQAGRLTVGRSGVRAVTWLADGSLDLKEIHVWSSRTAIVTVWHGDPHGLADLRNEFSDRVVAFKDRPYQAAAILLQLLLSTVDRAITSADERIDQLHSVIEKLPNTVDPASLAARMEKLRANWLRFDRYASGVRSALVGIEAIPGIHERAVEELNDYQENVEDVENRLHERFEWATDIMQDYATALTRQQGEQISRLTIVSVIFLPLTALTGFFGMNFGWMGDALGSLAAFLILGVLLPATSVVITVLWLRRRGLL